MLTPGFSLTATERVLPRLALDFTTGVLDARVTVTRALNTATRVNSSGYIEGVNANLPRFDYDPVTLFSKGLLVEEARLNVILQSENFGDAAWTTSGTNINVSTDAVVSPANTQTADILVPTTTPGQHRVAQLRTGLASASYTSSVYVKTSGYTKFAIVENAVTGAYVSFDCAGSGSKITESGATGTITPVGNGWFRATMNIAAAQTAYRYDLYVLPDSYAGGIFTVSWAGDGSKGLAVYGAQLEAGAAASSYIPTTTSGQTRNADAVSMTGTNFSDWWAATNGGAVAQYIPSTVSGTRPVLQFDDTTADNIIALRGNAANPELYIKATTDQAQIDAGTIAANTTYRLAGAWNTNDCGAAINGGAAVTDTSVTVPTVTQARLGTDGTNYLNGWLQTVRYWPQRLLNAEIQAFSKL